MSKEQQPNQAGSTAAPGRSRTAQAKYELREQIKPTIAPLSAAIALGLCAGNLQAAVITVDTLDDNIDSGVCSLRSATYAATIDSSFAGCPAGDPGSDTIEFAAGLTGTIQLDASASGTNPDASIRIGSDMAINGPGIDALTIRGDDASPVIYAKYDSGGGYTASQVSITGLTITNGRADFGGGIYSKAASLSLLNTRVSDNVALEAGGGIWHQPDIGPRAFNLVFSEITGNQAASTNTNAGGAGVGIDFGSYDGTVQISNSTFYNNVANGKGAGLYVNWRDYANLGLNDNLFDSNRSKYAGGGAYLGLGYAIADIEGNEFTGNDSLATLTGATGDGGGMVIVEDQLTFSRAQITLAGNIFDNNTADGNGGGLAIDVAAEATADTKFIAFSADTDYFISNQTDGSGGGLHIIAGDSVDVDIQQTITYLNSAGIDGGGAFISALNSTVTSDYLVAFGDQAGDYGGGIRANLDGVEFNALDLRAKYASAQTAGGGIALICTNGSSVTTSRMGLVSNDSGFGGGIHLSGSVDLFEMNESVVTGNTASAGAGLDLIPNAGTRNVYLKYSEISNNQATIDGGGVFAVLSDGTFRLWNSTVSTNTAGEQGGGLWLGSSTTPTMTLSYSTIAYNAADEGGGFYLAGADTSVYSAILSGNTATTDGPAADGNGQITVSYSLVDDITTSATIINDGNNLLKYSAELGALADNGGFSRTHAPNDTSPVIDTGPDSALLSSYDQRGPGYDRLFGSNQDMGAFERQTVIDTIFRDRFEQP